MATSSSYISAVVLLLCTVVIVTEANYCPLSTSSWPSFGGNNLNHRSAVVKNPVPASPTPKFKVDTGGADVSCTPTVYKGYVYFGDWAGYFYKVNAATGFVVWRQNVTKLVWHDSTQATNKLIVRAAPTLTTTGLVIVGTQTAASPGNPVGTQGFLLALKVASGNAVWKYDASHGNPFAIITAAATVYNGAVFAATASNEEGADGLGFPCCNFRGTLFSLNLADGQHKWTFFTTPENGGAYDSWAGSAIWGSAPSIDEARGLVYVASGNSYRSPPAVIECLGNNTGNPAAQAQCVAVDGNWFNSVLAVNMATGKLAWGRRMSYFDVWTVSCLITGGDCPYAESPDYDFGQAPLYFPNTKCGSQTRDILVAAQKSGFAHGLDASNPAAGGNATFRLMWSTNSGTGGYTGGSQWGTASDGKRVVFLQNVNSVADNVTLTKPALDSPKWTTGSYATAVDICTGAIKWQAATPAGAGAMMGAPTYARALAGGDEYVFYPTMSSDGRIVVLRAETGEVHTVFAAGPGSILGGPSIVNDVLYVSVGYRRYGLGTGTPQYGLAAFSL